MKLSKILLRWYKSFHFNYRGTTDKGEASSYRPWNKMSPAYARGAEFPFIEIPVERDITTIVGANESGKSHLLNAISKVVRGAGIEEGDDFRQTDLCHYAGVRTRNIEAWPNIGLQFTIEDESDLQILGRAASKYDQETLQSFAIVLAHDGDEEYPARLFLQPNNDPISLNRKQLADLRLGLPTVQFIDSHALLPSELPLASLIAGYGEKDLEGVGLPDRRTVERALRTIQSFSFPQLQQQVTQDQIRAFDTVKATLSSITGKPAAPDSLEVLLFRDILGIELRTLRSLYDLSTNERGYVEGMIGKWNEEIRNQLNLSHFWHQDEEFSLSVDYKDGVVYFEIRDKTDSVYTFRERSSGLKFFLSYYIQAKALEMTSRNRKSIILMDEPDSALSIMGQRNLLAIFESLVSPESSGGTCQLVYTTHSPYLINRNFPRRIRVVKKEDAEEGTQYIEHARSRRYEPVRTALGIDSAPSLFLGADNVLLEGPTDQYLLAELIRIFATPENVGSFIDLNSLVMVSADGAGNVGNVLAQSTWADEPVPPTVILLDSDKAAEDAISQITGGRKKRVLIAREFVAMLGDLIAQPQGGGRRIVSIEDIIPARVYGEAVCSYVEKWLPETNKKHASIVKELVSAPEFGREGLVASTEELFKKIKPESDGQYDKMGILQEVLERVNTLQLSKSNDGDLRQIVDNVTTICDFIRDGLEKSRAVVARQSTTQFVKRIINQFKLLNRDNVPITALQSLFKRIGREALPIGADGEVLAKVTNRYLSELDKLRSAGQERVVGEDWQDWLGKIEAMRRDPLSAGSHSRSPISPADTYAEGADQSEKSEKYVEVHP
jgi:predicted ATPase